VDCGRVQDAYSLRCMPQVHGAAKDTLRHAIESWRQRQTVPLTIRWFFQMKEKFSVVEISRRTRCVCVGFLGIATAAMASISECRIEKLINPAMSGLLRFDRKRRTQFGMMIVQVRQLHL